MALTAKRISKLLRRGEPGRHLDARGLYLVVVSRTAAHWEKRYQLDGREHYHGLGSAFVFSLAQARERGRRASELLADGVDPLVQKREAKAARIAAAAKAISFGEAAADFYRAHSPGWRHVKHISQWRSSILGLTLAGKPATGDYCKALRPLPVAQIDTPIVLSVLKPSWHDKAETMSRVRARIAAVLDYAKACGYRQGDNPANWDVIGKLLPSRSKVRKVEHHAALPYAELPTFMVALGKREGTAARALEFLIFTAARTAEVLQATWGEIDLDAKLWVVPANRMKGGREHRVALSDRAVELLRELPVEDGNAHVFIGPLSGSPLSEAALRAVIRRMGHDDITTHGFRSSFRDWCAEMTNYPNHVIEMALAHAVGDKVEAAYRRGDLLKKRRQLAEAWAKYCTSPPVVQTAGGRIVSIGGGRS
jgi:integrase